MSYEEVRHTVNSGVRMNSRCEPATSEGMKSKEC